MKNYFSRLVIFVFCVLAPFASVADGRDILFDLSGELPEISPEIERRVVDIPNIDALDLEVGAYGGMLSVEDFGANYYYGLSVFFHVTEDLFLNANYGRSEINDNSFGRDFPLFGESGKRKITDLNFLIGWNALSGEMFWSRQTAFTTDLYLLAGAGSIEFDGDSYFNVMGGAGLKILFTDWFALRMEAKFSEYDSNFFGFSKKSHNVDVITGISVFF